MIQLSKERKKYIAEHNPVTKYGYDKPNHSKYFESDYVGACGYRKYYFDEPPISLYDILMWLVWMILCVTPFALVALFYNK